MFNLHGGSFGSPATLSTSSGLAGMLAANAGHFVLATLFLIVAGVAFALAMGTVIRFFINSHRYELL